MMLVWYGCSKHDYQIESIYFMTDIMLQNVGTGELAESQFIYLVVRLINFFFFFLAWLSAYFLMSRDFLGYFPDEARYASCYIASARCNLGNFLRAPITMACLNLILYCNKLLKMNDTSLTDFFLYRNDCFTGAK